MALPMRVPSDPPVPWARAIVAVGDLDRRVGLLAELAHRLDDLGHAAAVARMVVAQAAAVGVERQLAVGRHQRCRRATNSPPLPFSQKPRSSRVMSTVIVKES